MKLVERPQPKNIGPKETKKAKASVKVSSTEAGVLFGNLTYDASRGGTLHVLTLNEIRIDAGEYIYPDVCTDSEFRKKWNEFNWESKVIVN